MIAVNYIINYQLLQVIVHVRFILKFLKAEHPWLFVSSYLIWATSVNLSCWFITAQCADWYARHVRSLSSWDLCDYSRGSSCFSRVRGFYAHRTKKSRWFVSDSKRKVKASFVLDCFASPGFSTRGGKFVMLLVRKTKTSWLTQKTRWTDNMLYRTARAKKT